MSITVKDPSHASYRRAGAYLHQRLKAENLPLPEMGIICGSGLAGLSQTLEEPTLAISYAEIPGFPAHCTVPGHKGQVVFGYLSGVPTLCFRGRFHSYEGHSMNVTVLPIRVLRCLNTKVCLITNAAGGLNETFEVGDLVCVTDHLAIPQLAGKNPLVGPNDDELGPRFPAVSNAYPPELRKSVLKAGMKLGLGKIIKASGVYCFVSGVSSYCSSLLSCALPR